MDIETEIAERLAARDKQAIELIYDHYSHTLYGITLKIVRLEHVAEDVMQESFIKIWKNAGKYDSSRGRVFTWILNIVRNTAIDHTRSKSHQFELKRNNNPISDHHGPSFYLETDHIDITKILDSLVPINRKILELVYFKGYTQAQVSDRLNIPIGTVKSKIRIALRDLKRRYYTADTPREMLSVA